MLYEDRTFKIQVLATLSVTDITLFDELKLVSVTGV